MIRLFTTLCKVNLNDFNASYMFLEAMKDFERSDITSLKRTCPKCGAKEPRWSWYGWYFRYLISYQLSKKSTDQVKIYRIRCSSCRGTHALLPDIIVPHKSYSLLFILCVLQDYYRKIKVDDICTKYQIDKKLLYEWKSLFVKHKKVWLGVLEDMLQSASAFLSDMASANTSEKLNDFYGRMKYSFLQGDSKTANYSTS